MVDEIVTGPLPPALPAEEPEVSEGADTLTVIPEAPVRELSLMEMAAELKDQLRGDSARRSDSEQRRARNLIAGT